MQHLDQEAKAVYASKDGKTSKIFPTLEWIATMVTYPEQGRAGEVLKIM